MTDTTWEVFLEGYLAPGLNGKGGQERRHWSAKKRDKERAQMLILANGSPLPVFSGPVLVEYIRYRTRGPAMDEDNRNASFKDIGDALQKLGVVENDSQIRLDAKQELSKFKGTRLRLQVGE